MRGGITMGLLFGFPLEETPVGWIDGWMQGFDREGFDREGFIEGFRDGFTDIADGFTDGFIGIEFVLAGFIGIFWLAIGASGKGGVTVPGGPYILLLRSLQVLAEPLWFILLPVLLPVLPLTAPIPFGLPAIRSLQGGNATGCIRSRRRPPLLPEPEQP
jgi:hypothetical protein